MLVKKDRGAMVDFLISKTMTPSHAAKVHSERGTDVHDGIDDDDDDDYVDTYACMWPRYTHQMARRLANCGKSDGHGSMKSGLRSGTGER